MCLSKEDLNEMRGSAELEKVRNTLYKAYLEDFYRYCKKDLGGVTGEVMGDLLEVFFFFAPHHLLFRKINFFFQNLVGS